MRIFIESASVEAVQWALELRLADGIFVTPAVLDSDAFGADVVQQVDAMSRVSTAPVLVAVGAVSAADLHRKGRELAKISDTIVVAIPFVEDGVTAMTKLVGDGVRIAATFIATPAQALLAAKAGASYAFVPTDTLEQHGHDANATLRETRAIFEAHEVECDLVANGAGSSRAVTASFIAGADAVAVTADTLRSLMQHPITDRSVDKMLGTLSRRPRGRGR